MLEDHCHKPRISENVQIAIKLVNQELFKEDLPEGCIVRYHKHDDESLK